MKTQMHAHRCILIVGAGISGAVLAERFANKGCRKVLLIEKRNHIGGNCYDFINDIGTLVPKYGPHFFHTNYEDVWEYVNRFADWRPYEHKVLSYVDGQHVPVPVNITTVNKLLNLNITDEREMREWLEKNIIKIKDPKNSEESALSRVGTVLYEKLFKNYTKKQWDLWPKELDALVMNRIPVRTNFDDRYFSDKYQGMPKEGYAKMFGRMLKHPNIEVRLNTDYFEVKEDLKNFENVFFTGRIDKYFKDKKIEKLPFRSIRFEHKNLDVEYYQEKAVINYPNDHEYTRITEPKHATGQKNSKTTIIKEYPTWGDDPYYPIPNPNNDKIYEKYRLEADKLIPRGIYFIGRLANYKYINMDQAFKNALDLFDRIGVV